MTIRRRTGEQERPHLKLKNSSCQMEKVKTRLTLLKKSLLNLKMTVFGLHFLSSFLSEILTGSLFYMWLIKIH